MKETVQVEIECNQMTCGKCRFRLDKGICFLFGCTIKVTYDYKYCRVRDCLNESRRIRNK